MNYGIGNIKDKSKSLFTTTTAPTESGGVITLATTDIVESGFKVGDYLAYVDSDNISTLYSISAISSGTATLSLIGNIGGGGKQLYQHNIPLYRDNNSNGVVLGVVIITDTNEKFTMSTLHQWLVSNKFDFYYMTKYRNINGIVGIGGSSKIATGIGYNSMSTPEKIAISYPNTSGVGEDIIFHKISDITINDDDNHYIIKTL